MASVRKTTRLLEVAKDVVRLENELAMARAEFARLLGDNDVQLTMPDENITLIEAKSSGLKPLARTSSFLHRVQSVLELSAQPMSAHDIAVALGSPDALDSIRAALSKLISREAVERVAVGIYRATGGGHRRAASEDD